MGVVNVTPDSFSDGGLFHDSEAALAHALRLVREGADLVDVGGESTRPGSLPVPPAVELERVLPVIERLHEAHPGVPISIDTSKPEVMRAAVAAGASMINDVRALREPGALEAAAELGVPVCLMHMQGEPRTMQHAPRYADVAREVTEFLESRARACEDAGLAHGQLYIDPGFGFGKTLAHNLELLAKLERLVATGRPVLVGLSRKSLVGALTGRAVGERLHGSVALAVIAAMKGAAVVRAHDVGPTREALAVASAVLSAGA